jgi:hypothetical protein
MMTDEMITVMVNDISIIEQFLTSGVTSHTTKPFTRGIRVFAVSTVSYQTKFTLFPGIFISNKISVISFVSSFTLSSGKIFINCKD